MCGTPQLLRVSELLAILVEDLARNLEYDMWGRVLRNSCMPQVRHRTKHYTTRVWCSNVWLALRNKEKGSKASNSIYASDLVHKQVSSRPWLAIRCSIRCVWYIPPFICDVTFHVRLAVKSCDRAMQKRRKLILLFCSQKYHSEMGGQFMIRSV